VNERNIKLTIDEGDVFSHKQTFVISITDVGVEIRHSNQPVAMRDRSVAVTVGTEPTFVDLTLHVEECP
jgi:hypothetical protein